MSKISSFAAVLAFVFSCGPTRHSPGGDDGTDASNINPGGDSGIGSSCATSTVTAMSTPLDIYIMLDQSGSMTMDNKWTNVTTALETFLQQPNQNGISVGLGFFGLDSGNECTASAYSTASVEIAPLPGVATPITSQITAHSPPETDTPTVYAMQGAVQHAQTWASAHPGHTTVVVLATDGEPDSLCQSDAISDVEAAATSGVNGTPKILSFVIGVDDGTGNLTSLNGIAAAGGTGSAYIVSAGGSAEQQFVNALNAIRSTTLGCTYQIPVPTNGAINYQQVNISYTPGGGGMPVTIPYVMSQAQCPATGNAWYYDNAAAPTEIILCSSTCGTVEADTTGSVGITLGCQTVIQ